MYVYVCTWYMIYLSLMYPLLGTWFTYASTHPLVPIRPLQRPLQSQSAIVFALVHILDPSDFAGSTPGEHFLWKLTIYNTLIPRLNRLLHTASRANFFCVLTNYQLAASHTHAFWRGKSSHQINSYPLCRSGSASWTELARAFMTQGGLEAVNAVATQVLV